MKSQVRRLATLIFIVAAGFTTPSFAQRPNTATGDNTRYNGGSHGPERNDTSGSRPSGSARNGSHGPERNDTSGSGHRNTPTGDNVRYNGGSHGPERNDTSGSRGGSNERPNTATGDNVRYNGGSHGPERNDTSGGGRRNPATGDNTRYNGGSHGPERYDNSGSRSVPTYTEMGDFNYRGSTNAGAISLPNGDKIALPHRSYWPSDALVSVTMMEFRGQKQYRVSITNNDQSITAMEKAIEFIDRHGVREAVKHGVAIVVDGVVAEVTTGRVVGHLVRVGGRVGVALLEPSPIGSEEYIRGRSEKQLPVTYGIFNF